MSIRASLPCFLLTLLSILHQVEGAGGHSSHRAGLSPSHPEVFVSIKPGTSGSYFVDDRLKSVKIFLFESNLASRLLACCGACQSLFRVKD